MCSHLIGNPKSNKAIQKVDEKVTAFAIHLMKIDAQYRQMGQTASDVQGRYKIRSCSRTSKVFQINTTNCMTLCLFQGHLIFWASSLQQHSMQLMTKIHYAIKILVKSPNWGSAHEVYLLLLVVAEIFNISVQFTSEYTKSPYIVKLVIQVLN